MNYLKQNIKFLRKKKHLNQEGIALQLNKSQSSIANWENGNNEPNVSELILLSEMFGVSLDQLVMVDLEDSNLNLVSENEVLYEKSNLKGNQIGNLNASFIDILALEKKKLTRQNKSGDAVKIAIIDAIMSLTDDVGQLKVSGNK